MTAIIRHCPDCGRDRFFEQHSSFEHSGAAEWCATSADDCSPEWYCLICGAVLLLGDAPIVLEPVLSAGVRDRVA
jgi:hypothetical protein